MGADILIVDDEADIRDLVAGILEDEGHKLRTAGDADACFEAVAQRKPQLVFLDIWLQGSRLDGLQILEQLKADHPDLPIVMISGHGNIETAVAAIRKGAYDFIEKPFKTDRLLLVVERALENARLRREVKDLSERSDVTQEIIGQSVAINQLKQHVTRVGPANSRVMIFGEPGAGKELVARLLHATSQRRQGPFVILNAATMTPEGVEAALFGVEGTDGRPRTIGALEEAHGGTLYLDEVADMPKDTQGRVLRVLTDQTFSRVGGQTRVQVDVRLLSSTSKNMEALVEAGQFREDLYHRLNVVPLKVPSLAERREDIPALIDYFMQRYTQTSGLPARSIAPDAMAVLQAHRWPGNVRELRNNVERLLILAKGEPDQPVTAAMLPPEVGMAAPSLPQGSGGEKLLSLPLREARETFEREYLMAQVARFSGNISKTAEFVGMERSALHRKLKMLGLHDPE